MAHIFWPAMGNAAEAKQVAKQGFWAAIAVAATTSAFTLSAITVGSLVPGMPINAWSFIDVGIFTAIALGVRKLSRIAAILGFVLYLCSQLHIVTAIGPQLAGLPVFVILITAFLNRVRGTFQYHKFRQDNAKNQLANVPNNP
jgi:hypothetical protein